MVSISFERRWGISVKAVRRLWEVFPDKVTFHVTLFLSHIVALRAAPAAAWIFDDALISHSIDVIVGGSASICKEKEPYEQTRKLRHTPDG